MRRRTGRKGPIKATRGSPEGTERGTPTMLRARDSELIFPIKDAASAALMLIKADCLDKAGIKQWVYSRARTFLADATLKDVA